MNTKQHYPLPVLLKIKHPARHNPLLASIGLQMKKLLPIAVLLASCATATSPEEPIVWSGSGTSVLSNRYQGVASGLVLCHYPPITGSFNRIYMHSESGQGWATFEYKGWLSKKPITTVSLMDRPDGTIKLTVQTTDRSHGWPIYKSVRLWINQDFTGAC